MPVKMRLQRRGKKGKPFYHIVIADGRAPRDGKFIEKIGTYDPVSKPATIDICPDKAIQWLRNGAQPSDTVRAILSYKGILYKYHLLKGVDKGALTSEQAEAKYTAWEEMKAAKISSDIKANVEKASKAEKERLAQESKINEARAAALAKKAQEAAAAAAPVAETTAETEAASEAAATEAPANE
ncbi:MAG: 30S ribosomal protein S16 [Bacteroidota bacterium]|nr:30S ribosomal protein S16 [Bacteroidota bacterium]